MLYLFVRRFLKKIMPSRHDGGPVLKLFYLEDFPDMSGEPFEFQSGKNKLRGMRYHVGNGPYRGAVIFLHGFGAGHNAYEAFIHLLAKRNYLVYAFDYSCCGMSEGEGWWNFSSSLPDLENFFKWFEQDEAQKGLERIVVGHSWGGFTAQNACEYNVDKVVSISGFSDVIRIYLQKAPEFKNFKFVFNSMQRRYFGKKGLVDTLDVLKKTDKKVLLIHGDKDDSVDYGENFLRLKEALKDKPNVEFYTAPGRFHQPYMSEECEKYLRYLYSSGIAEGKVQPVPEIDYDLLLEEDKTVIDVIYRFIEK